ncbi:hypothetical protein KKH39_05180 [Patescibacteria group bacterium]|nr:hypothetical protein [Patescibacteria group bacterium]
MTIRSYNIAMLLATVLAWLGFFIIINSFDPYQGGLSIFLMFYFTLFLSILGTLSLLGFLLRSVWNRKRGIARVMVMESFRQAVIFSSVLLVALFLQSLRLLTWWNTLLLVVLATTIEFVFLVFRANDKKEI